MRSCCFCVSSTIFPILVRCAGHHRHFGRESVASMKRLLSACMFACFACFNMTQRLLRISNALSSRPMIKILCLHAMFRVCSDLSRGDCRSLPFVLVARACFSFLFVFSCNPVDFPHRLNLTQQYTQYPAATCN